MAKRKRRWISQFSKKLKASVDAATVEDAVSQIVERKLRLLGTPQPPIDLSMLASVCGIMPKFEVVEMQQDGRLINRNGKAYVQVNIAHSYGRRRFSSAHEINHKALAISSSANHRECFNIGTDFNRAEEELLCDIGARRMLLLTTEYLSPMVSDVGFSLEAIFLVQQQFGVSFEAAARALAESSYDEVAVVYFAYGFDKDEEIKALSLPLWTDLIHPPDPKLRVVRTYRSAQFPVYLPHNKSVEEGCIASAIGSSDTLRARERLTFDNRTFYRINVEAVGRKIYVGGRLVDGVIALLSAPGQDR